MLALLIACVLCLFGFALLALGQERHHHRVFESNRPLAPVNHAQRAISFIAIGLALPVCIAGEGAGFGSLLWVVLLTAAALAVALTLTWQPRWLRPLARLFLRSAE